MRRAALLVLAVLASVALNAPTASAAPHPDRGGHHRPPIALSGSVEGQGTYELGTVCAFAWEVVSGTFDASRRPGADGTFTLDFCVSLVDLSLAGTFTAETTSGVTLSGTLAGSITLEPAGSPIEFTLTVLESSGARRPITGTISLTGIRTEPGDGTYSSTIAGTFVTDLHM
jgi:hypothetical protein